MEVPVIDLTAFESADADAHASVVAQWNAAFSEIGFATIVGHGIPEDLLSGLYHTAQQFFDLPLDQKLRSSFPGMQRSQGYVPPDMETIGATRGETTPPDLCESISFSHIDWDLAPPTHPYERETHRPNLWPTEPAAFKTLAVAYFHHATRVVRRMMRLTAEALGLPPDHFDPFYDRMGTTLRIVDYPDQTQPPLPGQLRYGAHTDFSCFTLLRQDDAPGGLQVLTPDGEWVDVRPLPGALIVNAADTLARWTNDRFRSNPHRVINPPRDATGSTRRTSIVMFTGPNRDSVISCLPNCGPAKYPPIPFAEFLAGKIRANMPKPLE